MSSWAVLKNYLHGLLLRTNTTSSTLDSLLINTIKEDGSDEDADNEDIAYKTISIYPFISHCFSEGILTQQELQQSLERLREATNCLAHSSECSLENTQEDVQNVLENGQHACEEGGDGVENRLEDGGDGVGY